MKRITILGSTGSIGKSTLNLLAQHNEKFEVVALTANSRIDDLFAQCMQFNPSFAVVTELQHSKILQEKIKTTKLRTQVLCGNATLEEVAALPEVDYVMAGIVGAAGLLPTLAAAKAGKRILLANKEALVMSGALFMKTIHDSNATLLPVDSEHNAIFQCMPNGYTTGMTPSNVEKIILTASGGPFRNFPLDQFETITPQQAITHPTWDMGAKISVDSATMMNKGFEVIEAHWLFKMDFKNIEVMVHPQSIIHSLVCYQDGSMLAQLGSPDMRIPIAYTLSWPERMTTNVKKLNLVEVGQLTFEDLDLRRFPCMNLVNSVLQEGGTASAILNAANEIAVSAFLESRISFPEIANVIEEVLQRSSIQVADTLEAILEADQVSRRLALEIISVVA